jgi:glycerol-3-phosphate O-acyltransferase
MDSINLEFFIEGTRSRTNKILSPKYGFLNILTKAYYRKKVEDLTFIPVTINYTRTLEGETFPIELTGQDKVKESLGRLVKAVEIFSMNLGSIYLDFCEPIVFSQFNIDQVKANPKMNPDLNEKDRLAITNALGLELIYSL